jgi:uncharacterized membrane protein YdjX (TVP38/TMEM64 family)
VDLELLLALGSNSPVKLLEWDLSSSIITIPKVVLYFYVSCTVKSATNIHEVIIYVSFLISVSTPLTV